MATTKILISGTIEELREHFSDILPFNQRGTSKDKILGKFWLENNELEAQLSKIKSGNGFGMIYYLEYCDDTDLFNYKDSPPPSSRIECKLQGEIVEVRPSKGEL